MIATTKAVRVRGIIFSAPMVRAILAGTKTQTRRIVKPPKWSTIDNVLAAYVRENAGIAKYGEGRPTRYWRWPFVVGQRLWVRETWGTLHHAGIRTVYKADGPPTQTFYPDEPIADMKWRPSIYMPRRLSRITLEITDVRAQRLQDISDEDARAEGVEPYVMGHGPLTKTELLAEPGYWSPVIYRNGFSVLWDRINGAGAWNSNPWVWALTFKRVEAGHV